MSADPDGVAGIDSIPSTPRWETDGDREVRARGMHKRHMKLLALLREDLGGVTNAEAIAALLEFYYRHPERVVDHATPPQYR